MKKKILTLLLTVTALGVIPFSVYASDTDTNQTNECKEVITNQKIINEKNADGTITQAGLVTFEYQPISSDLKAGADSQSSASSFRIFIIYNLLFNAVLFLSQFT